MVAIKNISKICFIAILMILICTSLTYAASKEDLIYAINKTYYVAGKPFILPENIRIKGINYLRTHYLTDQECAQIMGYIDEAVAFANELGTTDISKVSSEDIKRGLAIVSKAVTVVESAPTMEEMKSKLEEENKMESEATKNEQVVEEEPTQEIVTNEKEPELESKPEIKTNTDVVKENTKAPENQDNEIIQEEVKKEEETKQEIKEDVPFIEDNIDYSQFIAEDQYEDVNFDDLKAMIVKEAATYSLKKILPIFLGIFSILVLIIIFLVVKLKGSNKKRRGK